MEKIQNIKQIVKWICKNEYEQCSQDRVKEILGNYEDLNSFPFFSDSCIPHFNIYINKVVGSILGCYAYYKRDFDVDFYICQVPLSTEGIVTISKKCHIYWIKDFNIRVCLLASNFYCEEEIQKFLKNNILELENATKEEAYSFNKADIYFANDYKTIFKLLYGDNKKSEGIIEIISHYGKKANELGKLSANEMFRKHKDLFIEVAAKNLSEHCTLDCLDEYQKNEIIDELSKLEEFDEIIKMIFTFMFTFNSIKKYQNLNFLDYTFISVELFKITELVFNRFLNIYWKNKKIQDVNSNDIIFSNKQLELGKMYQFYKSKDKEIINHLKKKINLTYKIEEILPRWISKTRNGFLHKDILDIATLEKSIEDSINILFLVIATIKK